MESEDPKNLGAGSPEDTPIGAVSEAKDEIQVANMRKSAEL
jgi:hypothetical protein